ncbi:MULTISPECIES: ABC transporter permease [unclassified Bosea (in: a-proteobacteria)]|uniref:ABC transporter permease n=1 Tax=unclassified Bosea (in: a-proteobacteria) TaxID=2653178 RepID=UPI0009558045|nr:MULTISPECIES: ABC transporter permease [unclassified Bosea (in: a-proteobacteria)]TAJ31911.1 MAG: ABC transporter permease [Bosea sp. (in: a-proteobacteria)]SIR12631.1 putative spermidine/putrescine transport system permease protein [Bosea sp. TND4EK4]
MNGAGPLLSTLAGIVYALILAPIVVVFALAFSADNFILFPPSGYSLRWFQALGHHGPLLASLWLSVQVASVVTLCSLLVGVPAALALAKGEFRGKDALTGFFLAPLLLPTLITGLALLLFFTPLRLTATLPGLVLGHMTVTVPFVIRMMTTALANLPHDIEAAAATLGATPWRVVRRVTLPLAAPGLIACACLSFLLSFDETVISLFISGPRASTLPVEMVRYVEGRTDPLIAALSVVLIIATLIVVVAVERLVGVARAVGK